MNPWVRTQLYRLSFININLRSVGHQLSMRRGETKRESVELCTSQGFDELWCQDTCTRSQCDQAAYAGSRDLCNSKCEIQRRQVNIQIAEEWTSNSMRLLVSAPAVET
ncbi:unnamed protein product [Linum tenue]|uniref:Uncharacterized protein n=1 Tax=Linum tenue TaxID=586396 RepID=A0AAV0NYW5_9ROSI|nr:unnamed protein product [Linum tenue]